MDIETVEKYRLAGKIAREALKLGVEKIKENVTLLEVAQYVERTIYERGAKPAFPVNIAIDNVAAHFTPRETDSQLKFAKGNVVKLDVGVHVDGFIGDTAMTVEVGTSNYTDMIKASKEALEIAIEMLGPGVDLSLVGEAIENHIKSKGFLPIENLTGHSLEKYNLHAGISVPNVKDSKSKKVEAGTVLAIEPFATNGAGHVDGKKCGNIYRLVRVRPVKTEDAKMLMDGISTHFNSLPFTDRWCGSFTKKLDESLQILLRAGVISSYPILRDIGNGIVTQAEHTVMITTEGCEKLT